ncbi:MAG: hypothetical protein PHT54_02030 [Candidatus Nanoarchaeia archaeon]|nr:hypothetical protein [Candidatus Nanoarchaeia archaeon]
MLNKIKSKKPFSKGKRSVIYIGYLKNKKIAIKKLNKRKDIKHIINNEANYLKILNKQNIGPSLIYSTKTYMVYEFIEGIRIETFLEKETGEKIKNVIKKVLDQCYILDRLGINKLEMNNPYKHILINKNKVKMIDFERCYQTEKPKNLTQFISYLTSKRISGMLKDKKIRINTKKLISLCKKYKKDYSKISFNKIKDLW